MLFNSYSFVLLFLPVTLAGYFLLSARAPRRVALGWLALCSLFFYGWSGSGFLAVFAASLAFNWLVVKGLAAAQPQRARRAALVLGISGNLAVLGYFKYWNFFVSTFAGAQDSGYTIYNAMLPVGISFYTFQQIAYVVDAYRERRDGHSLLHHALFIAFFPQLIAGPIVHHKEMMPQFERPLAEARDWRMNLALGISIFAVGLFKKTVIADGMAGWADAGFGAAAGGKALSFADAWVAVLSYTFQLYFDFSGYSDMALGLARMFGIVLPVNFLSPYKAHNIIEFWRRWHITLSRFLRDYLYIPLGGNRKGKARRYANLLSAMAIGGLWHGAGWTFVLWGAIHGLLLALNHLWRAARTRMGLDWLDASRAYRPIAVAVTFMLVAAAWVPFRAPDLATAENLIRSMLGLQGGSVLDSVAATLNSLPRAGFALRQFLDTATGGSPVDIRAFETLMHRDLALAGLIYCFAIVFFLPNTVELFWSHRPALVPAALAPNPAAGWAPTTGWSAATALLLVAALLGIPGVSPFLYFQF